MKRNIIFVLAILLLSSISCTKTDKEYQKGISSDEVIFDTKILSKASGDKWDASDEIGVFAVGNGESLGDNIEYVTENGDGKFTASSTKIYYPQTGDLDIYAYYPYNSALLGSSYTINVLNQENPEAIDFMVANTNVTASKDAVALEFEHILSFVSVEMIKGEGVTDAEFADFTASIEGTQAVANYDIFTNDITFDESAITQDIPMIKSDESGKIMARAMVIPQSLSDARLKFTYNNPTNPDSPTAGHYYYVPSATAYESGKIYDYKIKISRSEVGSGTFIIAGWASDSNSDNDDITATEVAWTLENISVDNYPQTGVWRVQCTQETVLSDYDGLIAALEHYDKEVKLHLLYNKSLPADLFSNSTAKIIEFTADNVETMGNNAFKDVETLKIVKMENLTSTSNNAFENCDALETVSLENLKTVGDRSFYNCSNLKSVHMDKVTHINDEAFYGCTNLNETKISNDSYNICFPKAISVGRSAFYNCTSITRLIFSDLKSIGARAFANCIGIERIERQDIPTVIAIEERAFVNCTELEYAAFGATSFNRIAYGNTGSNGLKLGDYIFENCYNLHDIRVERAVILKEGCFDITPTVPGQPENGVELGRSGMSIHVAISNLDNRLNTAFDIFEDHIHFNAEEYMAVDEDIFGNADKINTIWGYGITGSLVTHGLNFFTSTGQMIDWLDDNQDTGKVWILVDDKDEIKIDNKADRIWSFKDTNKSAPWFNIFIIKGTAMTAIKGF